MLSIAASSSKLRQSPVLPLPVIPTQTAWVTRSLESYRQEALFGFLVFQVIRPAQIKRAQLLVILHVNVSSE